LRATRSARRPEAVKLSHDGPSGGRRVHEVAHLLLLRGVQVVEEVGGGRDDLGAAGAHGRGLLVDQARGAGLVELVAREQRLELRARVARPPRRAGLSRCACSFSASTLSFCFCVASSSSLLPTRSTIRARNSALSPPPQPWRWPAQPAMLPATMAAPQNRRECV
jgi:hypothetical protein